MSNENEHVLSVAELRRQRDEGELMTLPASGWVVRMRRVHLLDLVEQGKIPSSLIKLTGEMVSATKRGMNLRDMEQYASVVNLVVIASLLEPRVGEDATDEQLAVGELEMLDRLAIFNEGNMPSRRLLRFLPEQKKSVGVA